MKIFLNKVFGKGIILSIHPILLAMFPVLFLYTDNINQTSFQQVYGPLLFSVLGTLLLWLLLYLWMRNIFKAALAASLFLVLFFSYGHLYALWETWDFFTPAHSYLIPVTLLLWGYGLYFIKKARTDFRSTTKVLSFIAGVLIIINIFNLASYQISKPVLSQSTTLQSESPAGHPASQASGVMPDIYFIILDEYAHPDVIRENYDYDISWLIRSLEEKGFYFAPESKTQNKETVRAIASILNMEYTPEDEPNEVSYQRIVNNEVVDFLRSQDYQYIYLGSWYEKGRYRISSDLYFNYYDTDRNGVLTTEFSAALWNTTMLHPFYNYLTGTEHEGYYRDGLIQTLNRLKNVPGIEGPKFVYAHFICPHAPYVFGPNGERIAPDNYYNAAKPYYLGQYIYISHEIEKVIEEILDKSVVEPIIILQSDHGLRWTDEWKKIFNAIRLPDGGNDRLYDSISPVNTFRLIFNHYFNSGIELLEDR